MRNSTVYPLVSPLDGSGGISVRGTLVILFRPSLLRLSAAAVAGSSVYLLFIESFLLKMRRLSKVCGVGVRVIFEYVVVV